MVNNMNKNKSKQAALESRNNEDQQNVSNIDKYKNKLKTEKYSKPSHKEVLKISVQETMTKLQ